MNYGINVNLLKLKKSGIMKIKGKEKVVRCLVIPLEGISNLVETEHGIFLNLSAWESDKLNYGHTHYLKINLPKEENEKMSDDERRLVPIIGNMKAIIAKQNSVAEPTEVVESIESGDEIPF